VLVGQAVDAQRPHLLRHHRQLEDDAVDARATVGQAALGPGVGQFDGLLGRAGARAEVRLCQRQRRVGDRRRAQQQAHQADEKSRAPEQVSRPVERGGQG